MFWGERSEMMLVHDIELQSRVTVQFTNKCIVVKWWFAAENLDKWKQVASNSSIGSQYYKYNKNILLF